MGLSLGKTLQSPSLVLMKPRIDMNYVNCHRDMTEILLKSINRCIWVYKNLKGEQPFPKWQILDFSQLKEFADDNFKFDENHRKFSKRVENTEDKLLVTSNFSFSQCFQKTCTADMLKTGLVWNGLTFTSWQNFSLGQIESICRQLKIWFQQSYFSLTLSQTSPGFYVSAVQGF